MKQHWYSFAIPPNSSIFSCDAHELVTKTIDRNRSGPYEYCIIENLDQVHDLEQFFANSVQLVAPTGRLLLSWHVWFFSWGFWRRVVPYIRLDLPLLASVAARHQFTLVTEDIPVSGFFGSILRLLPGIRAFYPYRTAVFMPKKDVKDYSVTIIIPCKNEQGTITAAVERLPYFGLTQEILFVDGNSTDGTQAEIERVQKLYSQRTIHMHTQTGRGKKNGVLEGIAHAHGEVIILLDADLAIAPEEMIRFYNAIARGDGELINGARFIYRMEPHATPRLNFIANLIFPRIISAIIKQHITDSLCGTKVFFKKDYECVMKMSAVWGEDPFGDFTFLFAWGRAWKKIIDLPVHHHARSYGETRIHRFSAGWILLLITLRAAVCWVRFQGRQ